MKFPVKVSVPAIITELLLLFVNVVEAAGVTEPPKVMAELPAKDCVAENAAAPVPLLNVVPL